MSNCLHLEIFFLFYYFSSSQFDHLKLFFSRHFCQSTFIQKCVEPPLISSWLTFIQGVCFYLSTTRAENILFFFWHHQSHKNTNVQFYVIRRRNFRRPYAMKNIVNCVQFHSIKIDFKAFFFVGSSSRHSGEEREKKSTFFRFVHSLEWFYLNTTITL